MNRSEAVFDTFKTSSQGHRQESDILNVLSKCTVLKAFKAGVHQTDSAQLKSAEAKKILMKRNNQQTISNN
jgi:hypothetical protein